MWLRRARVPSMLGFQATAGPSILHKTPPGSSSHLKEVSGKLGEAHEESFPAAA
jgi:hypothetical protein